ncbi:MAG TPA: sigma-70 family RNA polymerase sigma factor [bacterium]|nr:sigma-70 family RNA polymerase sigma factor [bacterium]HPO11013.1 sigma-70 family RNA polymerase sigma factor [bacterium]HQL11886.1 sigma-70 family RNA polymerase sigma factor [bacterium]
MDSKREISLIKNCQDGKLDSFTELYDEYFEKIYNFIFYRVSHKETAEDLTSLTFIKALENINSFKVDYGFFSSWIYRIARNNIIDYYRSKKDTQNIDDYKGLKDYDADIIETIDIDYNFKNIQKYIENLSKEQKEILIMRIWDQLTYREIGKIIGKSEENCKVIFSRTIKTIRERSLIILLLILLRIIK